MKCLEVLGGIFRLRHLGGLTEWLTAFQTLYVQAQPHRRRGNPSADFPVVLDLVQVFQQFQTNILKNVGGVGRIKTKLYRNGVNQSAVSPDESFPRESIALQAE